MSRRDRRPRGLGRHPARVSTRLARAEIAARLRAPGLAPAEEETRAHTRYRSAIGTRRDAASVRIVDHRVVGERVAVVDGDAHADIVQALAPVDAAGRERRPDDVRRGALPETPLNEAGGRRCRAGALRHANVQ